ncbi:MAG: sulfotransferase, partial [Acetobacteraceae bacterium]
PLRRALALRPERAETLNDLAVVLRELGRLDEALPLHERAIELKPGGADLHLGLGETLMRAQEAERGREHIRAATELDPETAAHWLALGIAERALGAFDRAQECFRRALQIDPAMMAARWNLTMVGRQDAGMAETAQLRSLLADPDTGPAERIAAGFALGKILDDADRFEEAFPLFAAANAGFLELRAASGERFNRAAFVRFVGERIASRRSGTEDWGCSSELPVFVVGLPRSGTTLVEQIAASHSRVYGAGELPAIGDIARALGERGTGGARGLADRHVARLRALAPDRLRVIDKLPDNLLRLDLIAALFPGARIVHVRRDPRDTGLSNFFQFYTYGNQFAFNLTDIGVRVRETERLARHWHAALPLRMLTVDYEALVGDLEGQSRRLISFLGLEWEPGCLAFHRTERAVTTPSTWQVRQPIYTRSVGRWRHYERHLTPLVSSLGS